LGQSLAVGITSKKLKRACGRLNAVLASSFEKRGVSTVGGSFHLKVALTDERQLLSPLREVVKDAIRNNPLGMLKTERMVDLGPHFRDLSLSQQIKAREDWLDQGFLRTWCEGLTELRMVPADSDLAADLLELI
jgi:hypothetical protein